MAVYSIRDLEKLSGIKAHTIRIWEKRYQIIRPKRTSTNIRVYSDEDLKRIINVSLLNNNGLKISRIASMSFEEMNNQILELSKGKPNTEIHIDRLVVAMVDFDEDAFEKVLDQLAGQLGFQAIVTDVIFPFLQKVGVLWQTGAINPAQEHFISNLIRQKIIIQIAQIPVRRKNARRAMLFLPDGELHEIGLLFYHYIARRKGYKTYYLGESVPHQDLLAVYNIHKPEVLITSLISNPPSGQIQSYIKKLSVDFKDSIILISGLKVRSTAFVVPGNVRLFYLATELPDLLDSL